MASPLVAPPLSTASAEFRTWKKNALFLYDELATHGLTWPSLTVQWFPDRQVSSPSASLSSSGDSAGASGSATTTQRLLLGTHTSGQRDDYILLAQVKLPAQLPGPDPGGYDEDRGEIGSYAARPPALSIAQMIPHPGEVNRARYCPQNPDLIATRTRVGSTLLFDRTKHPSLPDGGVGIGIGVDAARAAPGPQHTARPDLHLAGQTQEGYGLAWSPTQYGHVISSSGDGTVAHWDLHQYQTKARTISPVRTYGMRGGGEVEDCAWHAYSPHVFAAVGMGELVCYDTRAAERGGGGGGDGGGGAALARTQAHMGDANAVAFAPASQTVVATGGDDVVKLWDLRRLAEPLATLRGHTGEVMSLAWSPLHAGLLASSAADGHVLVWDTSVGALGAQGAGDGGGGGDSAQLVFRHGGHTARPNDVAWSHHDPWLLASVADDNMAQVWRPARAITDAYAWPDTATRQTACTGGGGAARDQGDLAGSQADAPGADPTRGGGVIEVE